MVAFVHTYCLKFVRFLHAWTTLFLFYFSEPAEIWIGSLSFYAICLLSVMAIFLPSFYITLGGVNPVLWAIKFLSLSPTRVSYILLLVNVASFFTRLFLQLRPPPYALPTLYISLHFNVEPLAILYNPEQT